MPMLRLVPDAAITVKTPGHPCRIGPRRRTPRAVLVVAEAGPEVTTSAKVKLSITRKVEFGESVKFVGELPELGAWDPTLAPTGEWDEGDVWTTEITLPAGSKSEFKVVIYREDGTCVWDDGENRVVEVSADVGAEEFVAVLCDGKETQSILSVDDSDELEAVLPKDTTKLQADAAQLPLEAVELPTEAAELQAEMTELLAATSDMLAVTTELPIETTTEEVTEPADLIGTMAGQLAERTDLPAENKKVLEEEVELPLGETDAVPADAELELLSGKTTAELEAQIEAELAAMPTVDEDQEPLLGGEVAAEEVGLEPTTEAGADLMEEIQRQSEEVSEIVTELAAEAEKEALAAELEADPVALAAELEADPVALAAELEADLAALDAELEADGEALDAELEADREVLEADGEAAVEASEGDVQEVTIRLTERVVRQAQEMLAQQEVPRTEGGEGAEVGELEEVEDAVAAELIREAKREAQQGLGAAAAAAAAAAATADAATAALAAAAAATADAAAAAAAATAEMSAVTDTKRGADEEAAQEDEVQPAAEPTDPAEAPAALAAGDQEREQEPEAVPDEEARVAAEEQEQPQQADAAAAAATAEEATVEAWAQDEASAAMQAGQDSRVGEDAVSEPSGSAEAEAEATLLLETQPTEGLAAAAAEELAADLRAEAAAEAASLNGQQPTVLEAGPSAAVVEAEEDAVVELAPRAEAAAAAPAAGTDTAEDAESVGAAAGEEEERGLALAAGVLGLLAAPVVAWSEYTLGTTGCGLPPGPSGSLGAAEGLSYLVVGGIAASSAAKRGTTGDGLPAGPGKVLAAAEVVAWLLVVAGSLVAGVQVSEKGSLPSFLPDGRCFGEGAPNEISVVSKLPGIASIGLKSAPHLTQVADNVDAARTTTPPASSEAAALAPAASQAAASVPLPVPAPAPGTPEAQKDCAGDAQECSGGAGSAALEAALSKSGTELMASLRESSLEAAERAGAGNISVLGAMGTDAAGMEELGKLGDTLADSMHKSSSSAMEWLSKSSSELFDSLMKGGGTTKDLQDREEPTEAAKLAAPPPDSADSFTYDLPALPVSPAPKDEMPVLVGEPVPEVDYAGVPLQPEPASQERVEAADLPLVGGAPPAAEAAQKLAAPAEEVQAVPGPGLAPMPQAAPLATAAAAEPEAPAAAPTPALLEEDSPLPGVPDAAVEAVPQLEPAPAPEPEVVLELEAAQRVDGGSRLQQQEDMAAVRGEEVREPAVQVAEMPVEEGGAEPAAQVAEVPVEEDIAKPAARVAEVPVEEDVAKPAAQVAEVPVEEDVAKPAAQVAEVPVEENVAKPAAEVAEVPVEENVAEAAARVAQVPVEGEVAKPAAQVAEVPVEEDVAKPAAQVAEVPVEEDIAKPAAQVAEVPVEENVAEPAARVAEVPVEEDVTKPAAQVAEVPVEEDVAYPAAQVAEVPVEEDVAKPAAQVAEVPVEEDVAKPAAQVAELPSAEHGGVVAEVTVEPLESKSIDLEQVISKGVSDLAADQARAAAEVERAVFAAFRESVLAQESPEAKAAQGKLMVDVATVDEVPGLMEVPPPHRPQERVKEVEKPKVKPRGEVEVPQAMSVPDLNEIVGVVDSPAASAAAAAAAGTHDGCSSSTPLCGLTPDAITLAQQPAAGPTRQQGRAQPLQLPMQDGLPGPDAVVG